MRASTHSLNNEAYKARYDGKDNPNIALIHALKLAGVDFRACGQALSARKIESKQVNSDIQIDLWALTTMMNLQRKGTPRSASLGRRLLRRIDIIRTPPAR